MIKFSCSGVARAVCKSLTSSLKPSPKSESPSFKSQVPKLSVKSQVPNPSGQVRSSLRNNIESPEQKVIANKIS